MQGFASGEQYLLWFELCLYIYISKYYVCIHIYILLLLWFE